MPCWYGLVADLQDTSMDAVLVEELRLPTMAVVVEAGDEPREPIQGFPEECPEDAEQEIQGKTMLDSPPQTSSSPSVVFMHTNEDVKTKLEFPNASRASWSSTSSNDPVCRICHDTEDERGKTKLISPCGCSGSAEFTHKKCLQKWTRMNGATICEICKQGYKPKYIRFKQKLLTRQVMCMGSAASLPLLVVIIVGFFLLGEQLSLGTYDEEDDSSSSGNVDESGVRNTSKLMVSVCMIGTATFGIFLLCCFSIWAAKVQPHQLETGSGGLFIPNGQDVESGRGRRNNSRRQGVPVPLYFF
eukprot:XP_793406.1 PREDICTED: E3 ubiquitin-protein ligase MARCH11 [Strongylocentrotus purpuratus]